AGELNGRHCQRVTDPALAVPLAGSEARNRPHAVVRPVLLAAVPGGPGSQQPGIRGAWFDRHPADRFAAEVRDQTRGSAGPRIIAVGLLPKAVSPLLGSQGTPVAAPYLEELAVAIAGGAGSAEYRLQVCPGGPVCADDGQFPAVTGWRA